MKLYFNLLYTRPLLGLAGLMLCASTMANGVEPSISSQQNTENSAMSPDQTVMSLPAHAAMPWPMLPGESLNDVARLFYPKNKHMQQLFIAKTMLLSRNVKPNLNPAAISSQKSMIIIPNIKLLAKQSGNDTSAPLKRHKSYKLNDAENFVISPKMQADYDDLVKRNTLFKQELEKLNANLARLQQMLAALQAEVMRVIDLALPAPVLESKSVVEMEPVKQKQDAQLQNSQTQAGATNNHSAKSTQVIVEKEVEKNITTKADQAAAPISTSAQVTLTSTEQAPMVSWYLIIPILSLLLVISLFFGLGLYTRRQSKNLYQTSVGSCGAQEKKAFIKDGNFTNHPASPLSKVDFSLTKSEFTGVMPDADSDVVETLDEKEEGELMLEQAKIYVNLNRDDEAIRLLKAHIKATPKTALHHWLYLLDIYRDTNQKDAFLKYAKQLHQNFNIMLPLWDNTALPVAIASSLEEFSHISAKVTKLWADCEKEAKKIAQTKVYLDELLMDNRDNERTGFSMEVFQEIMLLRNMLDVRDKLAHIA